MRSIADHALPSSMSAIAAEDCAETKLPVHEEERETSELVWYDLCDGGRLTEKLEEARETDDLNVRKGIIEKVSQLDVVLLS